MANQYTGSLEHIVQTKFSMGAREWLEQCAAENLSYVDAQNRLGVTHGTIRKWARRYGIELSTPQKEEEDNKHIELFFAKEINAFNLLSRRWA